MDREMDFANTQDEDQFSFRPIAARPAPPTSLEKVATPDKLPEVLSRNNLPKELLRSSVVDSLVIQNEDLANRVTITLKKMALLEDRLQKALDEKNDVERLNEQISDRIELLEMRSKELEQLRIAQHDSEDTISSQKEQLAILESKLAVLTDARAIEEATTSELQERITFLEVQSSEYYREFRAEKDRASGLMDQLDRVQSLKAHQIRRLLSSLTKTRTRLQEVASDLSQANSQIGSLNKENQDLRAKLVEASEYVARTRKQSESDLHEITSRFERQIGDLNHEMQSTKEQLRAVTVEAEKKASVMEENIQLNNRAVFFQRKYDDLMTSSQSETQRLQETVLSLKAAKDSLDLENQDKTETISGLQHEKSSLKEQIDAQTEQLEATRKMWLEQQRAVEKLEEQNEALLKLNRDLSTQINTLKRQQNL